MTPIEIERKFLISYPNIELLKAKYKCDVKDIIQTYLKSPKGTTRRVRKITCNNKTEYIFTQKQRISSLSCYEDETVISISEYNDLLNSADETKSPVIKTRYAIQYNDHILEIDVYDFWTDFATLEIELKSEDEPFEIPDIINVIKEVSDDKRFKNTNLAANHVFDPLN
ncbi:MAG: CYTH domain-containing protein [Ruminococcaceae bacterium]|nr:CYTH domain-containing protein [Oscillospiraceae bacterium]